MNHIVNKDTYRQLANLNIHTSSGSSGALDNNKTKCMEVDDT